MKNALDLHPTLGVRLREIQKPASSARVGFSVSNDPRRSSKNRKSVPSARVGSPLPNDNTNNMQRRESELSWAAGAGERSWQTRNAVPMGPGTAYHLERRRRPRARGPKPAGAQTERRKALPGAAWDIAACLASVAGVFAGPRADRSAGAFGVIARGPTGQRASLTRGAPQQPQD